MCHNLALRSSHCTVRVSFKTSERAFGHAKKQCFYPVCIELKLKVTILDFFLLNCFSQRCEKGDGSILPLFMDHCHLYCAIEEICMLREKGQYV